MLKVIYKQYNSYKKIIVLSMALKEKGVENCNNCRLY